MTKVSLKKRLQKQLEKEVQRREQLRYLCCMNDDENSIEDLLDIDYMTKLKLLQSRRYLNKRRKRYRKRTYFDWDDCLRDDIVNYNDDEFLYDYCMSRESFRIILDVIKDHDVF